MPDTVYVIGSMEYGEQPCSTKGVGCGNGRSNGRTVLYSTTAGDPDGGATGAANMRTFTDLTYDAQDTTAPWCAYEPYFDQGCLNAPNGIHPDEHAIAINPGNPTQIFEGSDGGMIRTSGTFADISAQCDDPFRNGGGPLPPTSGSYTTCKRLLSRVPTTLAAHRQEAERHAAVHRRRDQPDQPVPDHGRHAGQRHLVEPGQLRQGHVHADHLRGRRQRRLRRVARELALQRVHGRVQRLELRERRSRRSGSSPRRRS